MSLDGEIKAMLDRMDSYIPNLDVAKTVIQTYRKIYEREAAYSRSVYLRLQVTNLVICASAILCCALKIVWG